MNENKQSDILVVIPARGGSKGIPQKNLRALNSKPLIYYSISNALNCKVELDCCVSSDDDEILLLAEKFGAVPLKRKNEISEDSVTLDPVIYDAYIRMKDARGYDYKYVITLQPTSPLLKSNSLRQAILMMNDSNIDTILSGVNDSHLTWKKTSFGFEPNYEKRVNRQYLPQVFKETGGFLITKSEYVSESSRLGNNVTIYPLSKKESIDIDDFEDWNLCEYYLNKKTLLFVVTGNNIVGMGHVYNTLSIANEILNHKVIFLVDSDSQLAYEKITEYNYEVYIQKTEDIVPEILNLSPDVIINDRLDTESNYVDQLKAGGCTVINFEDLGSGAKKADLVLNAMYPEKGMISNHYFGAKYFILRNEFLYTDNLYVNPKVSRVLLSFGGVDPNNFTERVLKVINKECESRNISLVVIVGLGYQEVNKLKNTYSNVEIKSNVSDISTVMRNSDIIFTSAGRTTFEAASIGVPSIVLCQNERELTHFFASQENGFYNLGLGYETSDVEILDTFRKVLNHDVRKFMSSRMLDSDLKGGKKRVMKLINSVIDR